MDFLITGGIGFQGYHLTRELYENGASIRILARDSNHAWRNYNLLPKSDRIHIVWGDVTNEETVRAAARGCKMIIHLAAQINVDESIEYPDRSIAVNVIGTFNALKAAKYMKTPFILGSSCEVYGTNVTDNLMDEAHPLNPRSPYAATKTAADRLAYSYHCSYDIPIVIARPGNVYGWGQKSGTNGAVIPKFMMSAMDGKMLKIHGDGSQGRDFVYIKDVVDGYMRIIDRFDKISGEVFNLGTGKNTSIKTIATIISNLGKVPIEYVGERAGEVKGFALDSSKAFDKLGWKVRTGIAEGLKETWENAIEHGGF